MRRVRRVGDARGYTLMELVVSALIALLVIAGLYVVYAVETRVFRGQEMVSQAQFGVRFAMETIVTDLQRAGFEGISDSSDTRVASKLCGTPAISPVQAVILNHDVAANVNAAHFVSGTHYNDNSWPGPGLPPGILSPTDNTAAPETRPDELILTGNFLDAERFRVYLLDGATITLQNERDSDPTDPFPSENTFNALFDATGNKTLVRVRNGGKAFFSLIESTSYDDSGTPYVAKITMDDTPACAEFRGSVERGEVSPMQKVRYRVQPHVPVGGEAALAATMPGIATRHDLVREYLDWTNSGNVVGNAEVLAENVVDFQVWFLFDIQENPNTGPLADQVYDFDLNEADSGGSPCNDDTIGTDSNCAIRDIMGAVIRVSVRTPHEDPAWLYQTGAPLFWYEIDPDSEGAARVRTLVTQVALPNLGFGL